MSARLRMWLVPAVALTLGAGTAAGEPFATIPVGDAMIELSREGCFKLRRGGRLLVSGARIVVAGTAWRGSGSQSNCRLAAGYPRRTTGGLVFRGEITEPVAGTTWRFEERVSQSPEGVRFRYEIAPEADTHCEEVALFVDFPVDVWRGKKVLLWPRGELTLPEKRPARRHMFHGTARRAVLDAGGKRQLTISFTTPAACTLQDAREFGTQAYQVYPKIFHGGRIKAGRRSVIEFTLIPDDEEEYAMKDETYGSRDVLAIGEVRLPEGPASLYERYEIDLDVAGTWETPFDQDQIAVEGEFRLPSGREATAPAFFHREYELLTRDGRSWIEPGERTGWKIRFAATETGPHSFRVTAEDGTGRVRSRRYSFSAIHSGDRGYIRVSRRDPRYFEFDDGTPYFAVGENVATYRNGVTDYDTWLPKLGKAGANYGRIWMWSQCFGLEWGRPGRYRLESAWELDRAIGLAEEHGIYIKLCLESWRKFEGAGSFYRGTDIHPYWSRNGGPCAVEMDVFTHPEAKRMFRNRLRYVVARWGYSTHVLAWEFWNEIDCVKGYRERKVDVVNWSAEMARYLRGIDPWGHLVLNSLGSFVLNDDLWRLPEMDFAQVHGYWHPTLAASKEMGKDMAVLVPHWIGKVSGFGKPALYAEFGLVNERWGHSPLADEDAEGVHLHNGLWSAVMTGSCGTAMLWWWGVYVEARDLYHQFTAISRFVEGVPWTTAGFRMAEIAASLPEARAMGLVGSVEAKGIALVWVQNRRHTWWNVLEARKGNAEPVGRIGSVTLTVPGLADGEYRVEWWDTWKGVVTQEKALRARDGRFEVEVRGLQRDVALKVTGR